MSTDRTPEGKFVDEMLDKLDGLRIRDKDTANTLANLNVLLLGGILDTLGDMRVLLEKQQREPVVEARGARYKIGSHSDG